MDHSDAHILPAYDHDEAPPYNPSTGAVRPVAGWMTLTLDPTAMVVKKIPASDSTPLYYLNKTLLNVNKGSSVHLKRAGPGSSEDSALDVWAIGEHFMAPMHTRKKIFQEILVARSHGLFVWARLREIVWDFSARVPLKKGEGMDGIKAGGSVGPTDPVYLIGIGNGPGTRRKNLFQVFNGKWICYEPNEEGEILALEREGGAECEGMPMLSIQREVDQEMMDFLVSAWLVTLWGEVGKRVRRMSKGR
jgi:hypothetical protein